MTPLQIVLGLGCVIAAAAVAIYYNLPDRQPAHRANSSRSANCRTDNGVNRQGHGAFRASKPGDSCAVCLNPMISANMHTMTCGHALCESPCFENYRCLRRKCPHCFKTVLRIDLPGDNCPICCQPMESETMTYLKCEHAIHTSCLETCKKNNYKICAVCKSSF